VGQTASSPGRASPEGWDWGSRGRRVRAGMEKPRDCWNPKRGFWASPGVRKGFLGEGAQELIGMSDMKRRERCAGQG